MYHTHSHSHTQYYITCWRVYRQCSHVSADLQENVVKYTGERLSTMSAGQ